MTIEQSSIVWVISKLEFVEIIKMRLDGFGLFVDDMKEKVYDFLKTIPKGKVATYGQIAEYLGNKKLARHVGNIIHNNPDPKNIPCHRVVNSKGEVSASFAFGGNTEQRKLLEQEGIIFESNGKIDLKKYCIG